MRFIDSFFVREGMYAVGRDMEQGGWYFSIPVSLGVADYEEYYSIPAEVAESFRINPDDAIAFADKCRRRECDDLLIVKPGKIRGSAI